MNKKEIFDHLAEVYISKNTRPAKTAKRNSRKYRLSLEILITFFVLASAFYGLSAFFSKKNLSLKHSVIFALTNNPIRIVYNVNEPYPQVESFCVPIPKTDASKYKNLSFSVRGLEEGYPGVMKIVLKNRKNETSIYFIEDVQLKWQKVSIPLEKFKEITDWSNIAEISFVIESWNAKKKKGIVLIDDLSFTG